MQLFSKTLLTPMRKCVTSQTHNSSNHPPIVQLDGSVFWQQLFKSSPVIPQVFDVPL